MSDLAGQPVVSEVAARLVLPRRGGPPVAASDRFVELTRRLSNFNILGAAVIALLTAVSIWGQWRAMGIVLGLHALGMCFNAWVNLVYLRKRGRSAEIVRSIFNLVILMIVNRVAGWPLPVWLWLPFMALAFDHLDGRVAVWSLAVMCVAQDVFTLFDGVPWIYPLTFTLLAVFISEISRRRFSTIREMLGRSDEQRTELEEAYGWLQVSHEKLTAEINARLQMEAELRQAQKLESVGRLASGVAHEINTPVQFVSDSVHFLREAAGDILKVIEKLLTVQRSVLDGAPSMEAAIAATAEQEAADLPYLLINVPKAFARSLEGLSRVTAIVRAMKEFAHPGASEMALVDLNQAIESTLIIAGSEYKYVAELETDFGELPPVMALAGEFNQAILNIVVNAAHSVADVVKATGGKGRITVRTRREGDQAVISVADTGAGIPEEIRDRIFDPFFTTKEVGRGTGQGLAIARSVVVEKHKGELTLTTEIGKGTTFFIRLPISGQARAAGN
jgi:signal transduction histidine kinase